MEVTIQHLGDVKFEASARGHRIICDQPADNGGSDSGLTPPEYLLVSLGTCAGFYAAQYMKARSLPHRGLEVKVSAEKATLPARLGQFRIEVTVPGRQRGEGHATGAAGTVSDRGHGSGPSARRRPRYRRGWDSFGSRSRFRASIRN